MDGNGVEGGSKFDATPRMFFLDFGDVIIPEWVYGNVWSEWMINPWLTQKWKISWPPEKNDQKSHRLFFTLFPSFLWFSFSQIMAFWM